MANFTPQITNVETYEHMASGEERLDVEFEVKNEEGDVVKTKRLSLPVDVDQEGVKDAVLQHTAGLEDEAENRIRQRKQDRKDERVDSMNENLVGVELNESVETDDGNANQPEQ